MKQTKQMSESIRLGMLLAISGGFMDAYSYIARDHVFANAQTGNMLLLGVSLSEGELPVCRTLLFPRACVRPGDRTGRAGPQRQKPAFTLAAGCGSD